MVAPVDSSDSDSESRAERADLRVRKCRHQRDNSDDESDVSLVERWIMIRSRTANKNVSTVNTKASMEVRAGRLFSHKEDFSERGLSLLLHMEGVANRSTGSGVNKDIQVRQTFVGLDKVETYTSSLDECIGWTGVINVNTTERKSKKEQLKCLVDLFVDMLLVGSEEEEKQGIQEHG